MNGLKHIWVKLNMEDKERGKVKKECFFLLFSGAMLCILFLFVKSLIIDLIPEYATHIGHKGEEQVIYNLSDDNVIEQEFSSPQAFDFLTIHFSNHDQVIEGKTYISIIDKESKKLLHYEEKDNTDIRYGQLIVIPLESGGIEGVSYILKIQFEGMGENGLGIFGFSNDSLRKNAYMNGEEAEYVIAVGTHTYTKRFYVLAFIAVAVMLAGIIGCFVLITKRGLAEEYLFLGIAIPVGIFFLLFFSINVVHDGGTHLAKVYHYSNVLLGKAENDSHGLVMLNKSEAQAFNEMYQDYNRENETMEMYWDTVENFQEKSIAGNMVTSHEYRETSASCILEYIPGVVGMTIGRIFGGSVRFNILFAKIFSFLFYLATTFWAIRITPYFKTVLAFTALLPMALYQATGITYDTIIIAVCILTIALFFKSRVQKMSKKDIFFLAVLSIIIGCCKGGFYLVIVFLFWGAPKENMGGRAKKWIICSTSLLLGLGGLLAVSREAFLSVLQKLIQKPVLRSTPEIINNYVATMPNVTVPHTDVAVYGVYGIEYIFANPVSVVKMIVTTLFDKAEYYIGSLVGYRMAWSDSLVTWLIIAAFIFIIALASVQEIGEYREKISIGLKERILYFGLLLAEVAAFHLLMLIVETPMGTDVIIGVQGRYFLMWLPVVMLILYNNNIEYKKGKRKKLYYIFYLLEFLYMFSFMKIFFGIE